MAESLTYIGRVRWRDDWRVFGIHSDDRLAHTYVVGKTGTDKSSLLEFLVRQDLANGHGLALFDPHGDLVEREHVRGHGVHVVLRVREDDLEHELALRGVLEAVGRELEVFELARDRW